MNLFIISYLSKERLIQHIYIKCNVFAGFLLTVVKSKVCYCNHLKISRSVTLRIDTMGNHHRCRYPASSSSQTETWCLLNSKPSSLQSLAAITLSLWIWPGISHEQSHVQPFITGFLYFAQCIRFFFHCTHNSILCATFCHSSVNEHLGYFTFWLLVRCHYEYGCISVCLNHYFQLFGVWAQKLGCRIAWQLF